MYRHHIDDMVDSLIKNNLICPTRKDDATAALLSVWDDKIAVVWSAEDVIKAAHDDGIVVDNDAAYEILQKAHCNHDCTIGITWDTFKHYLSQE